MKLLATTSRRNMLNYILAMVMLVVTAACDKGDDPDNTVKPNPNPDPAQYGTPFTGVPDARDAVIYQVNIRSFSPTRNFAGVTARLDSIKALGVNVIYLMPIHPVGQLNAFNSPYCVKDYKAVNPEFGTLADLRTLVDGAHARGMAVMLDWVGNHTSWDHKWMSNTNWYAKDNTGKIISPNGWNDIAQLNFNNQDMRKEMIKSMKFWVLTANVDGFRCDYSDGPPVDFWKQAIDTLRKIKTHDLLLLAEGTRPENFSAGFDYNFGFRFFEQLKKVYGNNQPASSLEALNNSEYTGAGSSNMVVRYITNHDVNSSDGTPLDLFGGKPGSMAAFVVAAYMKGIPMIYSGQEVGTPYRLSFPFTGTVIDWSLNPSMVAEYKKIIALRNSSEALRRGNVSTYSDASVCAFTKSTATETVFVASNLKNAQAVYTLPAGVAGKVWHNAFTGEQISAGTQITLAPYEYIVLK